MRKKVVAILACATAGGLSSVAHAQYTPPNLPQTLFFDPMNTGDATDGGVFSSGTDSGGATGTVGEPVGGPLTLTYPEGPGTQDGVYELTPSPLSGLNFYNEPTEVTITAPAGGSLAPLQPTGPVDNSTSFNGAFTWLAVTGNGRPDGGNNAHIELGLNNGGNLEWQMEYVKAGHNTVMNEGMYGNARITMPTPSSTLLIDSMFLYMDGTNEANTQFYIDFGETYTNTVTNTTTTIDEDEYLGLTHPFDIGDGPDGNNNTQVNLDDVKAGFAGGQYVGFELQNTTSDAYGNEAVGLSSLAVTVPEPGSLLLIGVGSAMMLRRRRSQA